VEGNGDMDVMLILWFWMEIIGRTPGEEEDTQGPREEENPLYPSLRQRYHDWWKEKDEPEPRIVNEYLEY